MYTKKISRFPIFSPVFGPPRNTTPPNTPPFPPPALFPPSSWLFSHLSHKRPNSDWCCARSDHTIYCYVNEKLRKITDRVKTNFVRLRIEMVSTPEQTKSVRWSLRHQHQSDFGKSKIVNKLRTLAIFFYIYVRERAVEYEKKLSTDSPLFKLLLFI